MTHLSAFGHQRESVENLLQEARAPRQWAVADRQREQRRREQLRREQLAWF